MNGIVYGLCDPTSWEVRYVGFTNNPRRRLRIHLWHAERGGKLHVQNWLRSLGCPPAMIVLDEAPCEDLPELERKHIATLRAMGCRLTNLTGGGDGGALEGEALVRRNETFRKGMSPQRRSAISLTLTGRKKTPEAKRNHAAALGSPETRRKISEAQTRLWQSEEYRQHMRDAHLGYEHTPAQRAKIAKASTGRKHTPEARAKISAAKQGQTHTTEARAKISAAHRGRKQTPESVAKRAAANRGKKRSPESRARMAAAQRRRFQQEAEARADG